ncbi:AAA family ATPase [Candidatus Woesebacteria bacterium]|nr:AAA family ATPase [Candidatus Woesebacteria bacterium]
MDSSATKEIQELNQKIQASQAPTDLKERVLARLAHLAKLTQSPSFLTEFEHLANYIEWVLSVPWGKRTTDILDLPHTKQVLDKNHFGLTEIKDRVLEYVSVMKLKTEKGEMEDIYRAPILCFVGLVGTGKTTIATSIAEAMGRKFERIPFGGMGDPLDLRGRSKMYPEAEPGKVIKAVRSAGCMNPVILLDEVDRVTEEGRSSIMGVLVELLDPKQNHAFTDHYVDHPVDLSQVLFIATANNTTNIATAVLDRIEVIQMPSYSDNEKIEIGRKYLLPRVVKAAGLPENVLVFDENIWPNIVRPLGFDAGVRTLERNIEGVVRKVARQLVEGKIHSVRLTSENIKQYLPQ